MSTAHTVPSSAVSKESAGASLRQLEGAVNKQTAMCTSWCCVQMFTDHLFLDRVLQHCRISKKRKAKAQSSPS